MVDTFPRAISENKQKKKRNLVAIILFGISTPVNSSDFHNLNVNV